MLMIDYEICWYILGKSFKVRSYELAIVIMTTDFDC